MANSIENKRKQLEEESFHQYGTKVKSLFVTAGAIPPMEEPFDFEKMNQFIEMKAKEVSLDQKTIENMDINLPSQKVYGSLNPFTLFNEKGQAAAKPQSTSEYKPPTKGIK